MYQTYCDCCGKNYLYVNGVYTPDCGCSLRSQCPRCRACIAHCTCGNSRMAGCHGISQEEEGEELGRV